MSFVIEKLQTVSKGGTNTLPFKSDQVLTVVDSTKVYLIVDGEEPIVRHCVDQDGGEASATSGLTVQRSKSGKRWVVKWDLSRFFSGKYRPGTQKISLFEDSLGNPIDELTVYILPEDVFTLDTVMKMLSMIEQSIDRSPMWAAESMDSQVFVESSDSTNMSIQLRIENMHREIKWCRSLLQDPMFRSKGRGIPEMTLIPRWYQHSMRWLKTRHLRINQEIAFLNEKMELNPIRKTEDTRQGDLNNRYDLRDMIENTLKLLRRLQVNPTVNQPILLSPLMQRDYRMRGLLQSLSNRNGTLPVKTSHQLSQRPMNSINRIFELWCAVWMVQELTANGFQLRFQEARGHVDIQATWHLESDQLDVWIDFEPSVVNCANRKLSSMDKREYSKYESKVRSVSKDVEAIFYGGSNRVAPDYLMRISHKETKQKALLVGDATFVSRHTLEQRKKKDEDMSFHKIPQLKAYRQSLYWKTDDGKFISPDWDGAFCVLPHTDANPQKLIRALEKEELWSVFAAPNVQDCTIIQLVRRMERRLGSI